MIRHWSWMLLVEEDTHTHTHTHTHIETLRWLHHHVSSQYSANTAAVPLIISRQDYCNSTLLGLSTTQTDCRRCTVQLQEFSPQCDLYYHICNFRSCLLAFFAVDFLVKTALLVLMETATTVMVWNQIFRKCCPQTPGNFQRASGKFKASRACERSESARERRIALYKSNQ